MGEGEKEQFEDRRGGHWQPLEYHRRLLGDHTRLDSYERAIRALVRPGDVVLDVGSGTGILAMLAARRGAARVHAVESAPIAKVAEAIVRANHLDDRVTVHHRDICELEVVEPVDLIISDFMGRYLIDDFMLEAVNAAGNWLKPTGRFCPNRITLYLTPVGGVDLKPVSFFEHALLGLTFKHAQEYALNMCYHVALSSEVAIGSDVVFAEYAPPAAEVVCDKRFDLVVERDGRFAGFAGWFVADLAPAIELSTGLGIDTHWGQYLFPAPPVNVEKGDRINLHLWLESLPGNAIWHWTGSVSRDRDTLATFELESAQRLGERGDV